MRTSSNQGCICVSYSSLVLFSVVAAIAFVVSLYFFEQSSERQALWTTYGADGVGVLLEDLERQEQIEESSARVFALLSN